MSDYWKSTPTYWCKFCTTYVRDTAVSRQQHEATGRHQSNIQRSLRDLHNRHERDARDSQRAKDEVARLNGIVSGVRPAAPAAPAAPRPPRQPEILSRQALREDRKRQMLQLVAMGDPVPEEWRSEMAMAGEWQTVSTREVGGAAKREEEIKVEPGAESFGVRKRKAEDGEDDDEDDEGEGRSAPRKGPPAWGTRRKTYKRDDDADLDIAALMRGQTGAAKKEPDKDENPVKKETDEDGVAVKLEADGTDDGLAAKTGEPEPAAPPVVFKKRKNKLTKT